MEAVLANSLDLAHVKFCHCAWATAEMLTAWSVAAEMLRGDTQLPCAFTTLMESPAMSGL